ncbi:MAG: hypothetical protein J3Q66DRAFT_417306 [Benniella sp.]|nr:MAG: hypothetical protein J3Q66DRAFT_417306 [Benniella sp.]
MKILTHHDENDSWTMTNTQDWLMFEPPGILITSLLTTVGRGKISSNKTSYQRNSEVWTLDMIRAYINAIRDPNFDATTYQRKGYVLRGAITTDGYRLNLEMWKLKELLSAKFKRLPPERLPPRLTTTVAGTSDLLARIWNGDPTEIKVIRMDPGEAFVVGVSALLPGDHQVFHNLGKNGNFSEHMDYMDTHREKLKGFYDKTVKKHSWDARRAKDEEFYAIANQILGLVGGSIGERRKENNKVAIGIGLGDFRAMESSPPSTAVLKLSSSTSATRYSPLKLYNCQFDSTATR